MSKLPITMVSVVVFSIREMGLNQIPMNYNPIWVCLKMVDTQNGCFNEENHCNPLELGVNID